MSTTSIVPTWSPVTQDQANITMTAAALAHLKKQIAKRGQGIGMRLGIKKSGCSGFAYDFEVIDEFAASDKVFPVGDNLVVAVDPKCLSYVSGTQIDYVREGLNAHFKFINPQEKSSCGCGESFTV